VEIIKKLLKYLSGKPSKLFTEPRESEKKEELIESS
jgi:hypothetical protein